MKKIKVGAVLSAAVIMALSFWAKKDINKKNAN